MATVDSLIATPIIPEVRHLPPAHDGRVRFSRDAYYRMFEIGVLHQGKRYELLDGDVYMMMSPIGPNQSSVTSRLNEFFVGCLPRELHCRVQQPVVISDQSEPEPDLAIVHRREGDYAEQHPWPADVVLLIEVAQSSLSIDLGLKSHLYAQSGIVEYWVVDLVNRKVITHRDAVPTGYRTVQQFSADSILSPVGAPMCRVDLGRIFR